MDKANAYRIALKHILEYLIEMGDTVVDEDDIECIITLSSEISRIENDEEKTVSYTERRDNHD